MVNDQRIASESHHRVSIVIPTLDEASALGRTLRCLSILEPPAWEVLIVDGGSVDATIAIAESANVKVIESQQRGRSIQMNIGSAAATGDVLCFLHADTLVPDDLVAIINYTLTNEEIVAGGFISLMAGATTTRWSVSLHNFVKTYYAPLLFRPRSFLKGLRLLFGDQVIFCRREAFNRCGGYDSALPIMEEADLCVKLSKHGRIQQINRIVQSSDRRVAKWGAAKATGVYLFIGLLWGMGVSATYLKKFYDDVR